MKRKRLLAILCLALSLIIAGCAKDEENEMQAEEVIEDTVVEEEAVNDNETEEEAGEDAAQTVEDEGGGDIEIEEADADGEPETPVKARTEADIPANPVHHCTKESDGSDYTDFSYVYFGSYPQGEVTDQTTIAAIDSAAAAGNATAAADGAGVDVWINGAKYRRIAKTDTNYDGYFDDVENNGYRYFKWERIRWRVLDNNDNGTLFVMADSALDCKCYNDEDVDITWENSTIRNWLNNSFYNTAFSSSEQNAIVAQTVVNEDNSFMTLCTEGGNNTTDKVYLLSIGEVTQEMYGFCSDGTINSVSRLLQASSYVNARGASRGKYEGNCGCWWMRSPGGHSVNAAVVNSNGEVYWGGDIVDYLHDGVAPALHINLSSDLWLLTDDGTSGEGGGN